MSTYGTDILLPSGPYQSTNYSSHSHSLKGTTRKEIKAELRGVVETMAQRCPNAQVITAATTDGRIWVTFSPTSGWSNS